MLRLATKIYPLVNTWIVFNTVNSLSEGVSRTVDGIIAPRLTSTNYLLRFVVNHGVSIPFRMIGGAIRPLGQLLRRSQQNSENNLNIFSISKINETFSIFTIPEFNILLLGIFIKTLLILALTAVGY